MREQNVIEREREREREREEEEEEEEMPVKRDHKAKEGED
jgi:hypothetical protein